MSRRDEDGKTLAEVFASEEWRSPMTLRFTVPGVPVPKERARVVNGRAFTPKRTAQWEHVVRLFATRAVVAAKWKPDPKARYGIRCDFHQPVRRGDADNLLKAVMDACNGVVWKDDRQVDRIIVLRSAGARDHGAVVSVEVLT